MEKEKSREIPRGNELACSFFSGGWEGSLMEQLSDPFESALSSMVSSPTASNANGCGGFNGHNIVLKELIGRLGSISNSGEYAANGGNSASASCYSTPLNSPKQPILENQRTRENSRLRGSCYGSPASLAPVRSGGFSSFLGFNETDPNSGRGQNSRVSSPRSFKIYGSPTSAAQEQHAGRTAAYTPGYSRENSSLSELIPANPRKRKACPSKGKGKETAAPATAKDAKALTGYRETCTKRCKSEEDGSNIEKDDTKAKLAASKTQPGESSKHPEPPKDYIHVRARRGQATDAHSLAERVRREKISERMKILQDLVPGCNKVAGKAVMLDEIINYVQSLQRQVEFLSMKLATVTPKMGFNSETLLIKDIVHPSECYSLQPNMHGTIPITGRMDAQFITHSLDGVTVRNHRRQSLPTEIYSSETASRVSTFWADDLHSVIQMGLREDESQ